MLVQVTSSICVSLRGNKSFYNIEICHKLPIVCQTSDAARPALHSCRDSDVRLEFVLLGSYLKEMGLPPSEFLGAHLNPFPVASRLSLHAWTPGRFSTWTEVLFQNVTCLVFAHFCKDSSHFLLGSNSSAPLMEPTLSVADPFYLLKLPHWILGK